VTFKDGTTTLGTANIDTSAMAQYTISTLGVGSHEITAVYDGGDSFLGSTSPILAQNIGEVFTLTTTIMGNGSVIRDPANLISGLANPVPHQVRLELMLILSSRGQQ